MRRSSQIYSVKIFANIKKKEEIEKMMIPKPLKERLAVLTNLEGSLTKKMWNGNIHIHIRTHIHG